MLERERESKSYGLQLKVVVQPTVDQAAHPMCQSTRLPRNPATPPPVHGGRLSLACATATHPDFDKRVMAVRDWID